MARLAWASRIITQRAPCTSPALRTPSVASTVCACSASAKPRKKNKPSVKTSASGVRRRRPHVGMAVSSNVQRRLVSACPTLVIHLPAARKARAAAVAAGRTAESLRPARPIQGPVAFGLGAVLLEKFDHRQTGLELHKIDAHDHLR